MQLNYTKNKKLGKKKFVYCILKSLPESCVYCRFIEFSSCY